MPEIRLSAAQAGTRFRDLAKKIRAAGATDLRKNLRKQIQQAGQPILDEVKDAVRTLNVTSEGVGLSAGVFESRPGSHGGGRKQRRKHAAAKARTEKARARRLSRGGGLREAVAKAVKLQITAKGIRFVVDSSQMPEKQQTLPRHLDSEKGWRHPVFGNSKVWVAEKGGPWFGETIKKRAPDFRAAAVKAMEDTKAAMEK